MFQTIKRKMRMAVGVLQALVLSLVMFASWSADPPPAGAQEIEKVSILVGKSVILRSIDKINRVSIANPAIANFVLTSPNEIYITGRTAGMTNMTLWKAKGTYSIYDIEVGLDVSRLKQQIHDILPEEKGLLVTATNDSISLLGTVSSAPNLTQALAIARAYAPEGKVHNLAEVQGVQQVMLEVRVAEMQRSLGRRLGVNFNYFSRSGNFGINKLAGLTEFDDSKLGSSLLVSPAVNALFRFGWDGATWTGFIDALKSDGLIKVLAEPTLIALSGQNAYFLAGGEYPVPVPQGLGTVGIEYKSFGVGLSFTPTVLAGNRINIKVAPEVSELDFSNVVTTAAGYVVPGLSTRKAETVVELADGQSFAIAGLLRDTVRDAIEKFPLLGDIPVLGALFRSRTFQKAETELIIIATPHLVKPLDLRKQPLPTDFYVEPNDTDFFLGLLEGQGSGGSTSAKGDLDGEFGHAMPKK